MGAQVWLRYLRWMFGVFAAVVVAVGACNILIDPTGALGTPRIPGISAIKPHLDHHRELSRWRLAQRQCASAGIFGNSRAEIGFDPAHPAFAALGITAFNHAVPGSDIVLAARQLGWLSQAGCAPQRIILGVEFFEFLGSGPVPSGDLFRSPAPRVDLPFLAETVFSLTGLREALTTVAIQRASYPATITTKGFNPLLNYVVEAEKGGYYAMFRQRAEENLKTWLKKAPRIDLSGGRSSTAHAGLEAFLIEATRSAREVDLVIYPYHAEIRLLMERLGLSGLFADWKRALVATAAQFASQGVVRVWDFSALHPFTLEAIPPRGDRSTHLQWYWEAGHFKKALGDQVLARILGADGDFGRQLDAGAIGAWLEEDRASVRAFLATDSPLGAEVDDVLIAAGYTPNSSRGGAGYAGQ